MNESDKHAVQLFQNYRRNDSSNEASVRHYLYVDRKSDAKKLGKHLESEGFKVALRRSGTGKKWLVLVTHRISVEESSVENYRDILEAAVVKLPGGEYDGWEADV